MIVYEIINKINGRRYIGKDSHNDPTYMGSGKILKLAFKKYGKENFVKTILEYCNTEDELDDRERHWIDITNARSSSLYYNIGEGGSGGDNITYNPNRDEFISTMTGVNQHNRMHGKKHSIEAKEKQKEKAQGRYTLDWFIERYGELGRTMYLKRNERLSSNRKGKDNPAYIHVDKFALTSVIKDFDMNFKELCVHFGVGSTAMYGKFKLYFDCKNLTEVKNKLL